MSYHVQWFKSLLLRLKSLVKNLHIMVQMGIMVHDFELLHFVMYMKCSQKKLCEELKKRALEEKMESCLLLTWPIAV